MLVTSFAALPSLISRVSMTAVWLWKRRSRQ